MKNQRKQDEHEAERAGHKGERVLIMKIEGLGLIGILENISEMFQTYQNGCWANLIWIANSEMDYMNNKI